MYIDQPHWWKVKTHFLMSKNLKLQLGIIVYLHWLHK